MLSGFLINSILVILILLCINLALKSFFDIYLVQKSSTFTVTMVSLLLMSFMQIVLRTIDLRVFQADHQNACAEHAIQTIMYIA